MELMSVLLFCAFVTQLSLALGVQTDSDLEIAVKKLSPISNVNSTVISLISDSYKALNINAFSKANEISELQPFTSDDECKHCTTCMKKALDIYKNYKHTFENFYPVGDSQETIKSNKKFKRNAYANLNNTETVGNTKQKTVKVTKYKSPENKIYAIKVNEISRQSSKTKDGKSTCKVYSVKKAYPCESEESTLLLKKRKVNKKKASKQKSTHWYSSSSVAETSLRPPATTAMFKNRKLRVENSMVPESFMPSVEESY